MTEQDFPQEQEGPIPATLAFRRNGPALAAANSDGAADRAEFSGRASDQGDDERILVLLRLDKKSRKLLQSVEVLSALYDASTNGQERRQLDLQRDEARNERNLCDARYSAIDNNGPFRHPGPQADAALLASIQRVDQAMANSAAVGAVLAAVHGLVRAFPAESTRA